MPRRLPLSPFEPVTPDTPLRLDVAAAMAFPNGGVTAATLRREAARGNLVIERIANKDFTTLAAIDRMRELCRSTGPRPSTTDAGPRTTASTEYARASRAHLHQALEQLKRRKP
jgi:hypothetical protein